MPSYTIDIYYILAGKSTVAGSLLFLFMRIREYVAIMKKKYRNTFSDVQYKVKFTQLSSNGW